MNWRDGLWDMGIGLTVLAIGILVVAVAVIPAYIYVTYGADSDYMLYYMLGVGISLLSCR